MLKKLIILLFIFPLFGFEDYQSYSFTEPTTVKTTDDWVEKKQQTTTKKELSSCGKVNAAIKVGVIENYPPFFWTVEIIEERGNQKSISYEHYGIFNDFVKSTFKKLTKTRVEIVTFKTNKALISALHQHKIDFAVGVPYNPEAYLEIDYIYPAIMPNPIIGVFKDNGIAEKTKTFNDFAGLKGVAFSDIEAIDDIIRNFESAESSVNILETDQKTNIIYNYLLQGNFDYLLTSLYSAMAYQQAYDLKDKIFFSDQIRTQQLFFAYAKNTDCRSIRDDLSKYLKRPETRVELEKLFNRYLYIWTQDNKAILPAAKKINANN